MGVVTRKYNHKATRIYKIIISIIGGIICVATLGLGIALAIHLPFVGVVLICGTLPLEMVVIYMIINDAKVETVSEEVFEKSFLNRGQLLEGKRTARGSQILSKIHNMVDARGIDKCYIYQRKDDEKKTLQERTGVIGSVKFTNIKPMQHYDNENIKSSSRKRVIEFKSKNKK